MATAVLDAASLLQHINPTLVHTYMTTVWQMCSFHPYQKEGLQAMNIHIDRKQYTFYSFPSTMMLAPLSSVTLLLKGTWTFHRVRHWSTILIAWC